MGRYNYHSHTTRCGHVDWDYSDEDFVKEYVANGFTDLAFTDHMPQKHRVDMRHGIRMDYSQLEDYLSSVEYLREKYKDSIKILSGFECEYLEESEDDIRELKERTDILITGQHYSRRKDGLLHIFGRKEAGDYELNSYTDLIEKAMAKGLTVLIAHPDFALISQASFGKKEKDMCVRLAKLSNKYDIPLEINLNHIFNKTFFRGYQPNDDPEEIQLTRLKDVLYPVREFWEVMAEYSVKTIYGIDTHHRRQTSLYEPLKRYADIIIGEETLRSLRIIEEPFL